MPNRGLQGFFRYKIVSQEQAITTMSARSIHTYDTTLRDGTQGEGVSLSLQDKLNIAVRLAEMGIDMIEALQGGRFQGDDRSLFGSRNNDGISRR